MVAITLTPQEADTLTRCHTCGTILEKKAPQFFICLMCGQAYLVEEKPHGPQETQKST